MTTTTTPDRPVRDLYARAGVNQWRVIKAEWIKFSSLRSNVRTVLATIAIIIAFGALSASVMTGRLRTPAREGMEGAAAMASRSIDPTALSMVGVQMGILVLGTTGVLAMTGEFSSGMIRVTAAAVPKRLPTLWAKCLILIAVATVTMTAAVLAAFFATQAVLAGSSTEAASLTDPGVLRALIGNIAYLVGVAVIGLALGALLRSAAAGISTLAGLLLIIPGLIGLILPEDWAERISPYLPSAAAQSFTTVDPTRPSPMSQMASGTVLTPGAGALVFAAWTVGLLIVAAVLLKRRDV